MKTCAGCNCGPPAALARGEGGCLLFPTCRGYVLVIEEGGEAPGYRLLLDKARRRLLQALRLLSEEESFRLIPML